MKLTLRNTCLSCALSYFTSALSVSAQIVPDKTLPVNSTVTTTGLLHTINGGTTVGVNLYHSFQDFSVPTNNTAYFNNAPNVQNVLTRVTGSSISNIDGTLKANGNTNLYLLNPNGIVFGANAKLDIGGSFVGSTANGFKFPDGSEFSATNPQTPLPLLTMSITPGLQYGTSNAGATIVNRGNLSSSQDLALNADKLDLQGTLRSGRDLTLLAQDVVKIRDTVSTPFVAISGRDLTIQGNNSVDIFTLNNSLTQIASGRNLSLISDGTISGDAHFLIGGNLSFLTTAGGVANFVSQYDPIIYANGDVTFGNYTGAALKVEATGSIQGGNITITSPDTSGAIPVSDPDFTTLTTLPSLILRAGVASVTSNVPQTTGGTTFTSATLGNPVGSITVGNLNTSSAAGNGGNVILSATQNVVTGNVQTYAGAIGNSGNITINANSVSIPNGAVLDASTKGQGNAGNITINAINSVAFSGTNNGEGAGILSNVNLGAQGNSGTVSIFARSVSLIDGAQISAITSGLGNAGNISINALDTILLSGIDNNVNPAINNGNPNPSRVITANFALGNSGNITINTGSISVINGGELQAATFGVGNAGNITVNAAGSVLVDGLNNFILGLNQAGGTIGSSVMNSQVEPNARGNAGNVTINASSVSVVNGAQLVTSTFGIGNGGNVTINATNSVLFSGTNNGFPSSVRSKVGSINNSIGVGNGGDVVINAKSVSLTNGANLEVSTSGIGNAGNVIINATDLASLDNSSISSNVNIGGVGNGGILTINSGSVSLNNFSFLSTNSQGQGNAGNININAQNLNMQNGSSISSIVASSLGQINTGNAGKINIIVGQSITLNGYGTGIFSGALGNTTGYGGSIFIDPQNLTLQNGAQISTSSFGFGIAGDITIFSNNLSLYNGSLISAFALSGNGGNINLNVPSILLLRYASNITATAFTLPNKVGNGGNININAGFIVAVCTEDSNIYANAFTGNGGNITINANAIYGIQFSPQLTSPLSEIVANNITGTLPGTVTINTLNIDPIRGLTTLPDNLSDPSKQVRQTCAVGGKLSNRNNSLIISGKGGLPKSPTDELSINRSLVEPVDSLPSSSDSSPPSVKKTEVNPDTPKRIIEANTVIRDSQGILRLVASKTPLSPAIPPLNCSQ